jgi:hypothetical protein
LEYLETEEEKDHVCMICGSGVTKRARYCKICGTIFQEGRRGNKGPVVRNLRRATTINPG